jgi:F420H(2)-dependent quinone reductase
MTSKQPGRGESPMIEQPNEGTSNASKEGHMPNGNRAAPKLPPRWFVRTAWMTHRAIHRSTGGRVGLAWPKVGDKLGYLRLKTTGRRTGRERAVILAYIEDGPNLVTLAMNGWAHPEPAWWLNLQTHPDAAVDLKRGSRAVRARIALGEERQRLWATIRGYTGSDNHLDSYANLRSGETAVVVLEPQSDGEAEAR